MKVWRREQQSRRNGDIVLIGHKKCSKHSLVCLVNDQEYLVVHEAEYDEDAAEGEDRQVGWNFW